MFNRLTTAQDELETFGLMEIVLAGPPGGGTRLVVDGQDFPAARETLYEKLTGRSLRDCPLCRVGAMIVTEVLVPSESPAALPDTS